MKKKIAILFLAFIMLMSIFALSACDNSDRDDEDEACKHKFGEWVEEVPATCTVNGTLGHYQCSKCDEYFDKDKKALPDIVIPAEHNFGEWIAEIPATCTKSGTKGHYACSACGKRFDANKAEISELFINNLGGTHNFVDEICSICGDEIAYSESLEYELVNNEYYRVKSIGTCKDKNIYIPKTYNNLPVKAISASAFASSAIKSITIPDSITSIGYSAFYNCESLKGVYISNISAWCKIDFSNDFANPLYYAHNLYLNDELITELIIPSDITSIGDYAFRGCSNITSVVIPDCITNIGTSTFRGCSSISNVVIPNTITSIGESVFRDCRSLTSVIIPDSVTSIGDYAFFDCDKLESIRIGDSVTEIGNSAFYYCISLTSLTIPDKVTTIGDNAFFNCSALEEIYFNAIAMNDLSSYKGVFYNIGINSTGIKLVIGKNVTKIPAYLFCPSFDYQDSYNSPKIVSVEFEEGSVCESIGENAFSDCNSLASITIPESVTSIGENAFNNCKNLVEVINKSNMYIVKGSEYNGYIAANAIEVHNGNSKVVNEDGCLFYTFEGLNYLVGYIGTDSDLILPENYNGGKYQIYKAAFCWRHDITSVTIGYGLTRIGDYAFFNCSTLRSIKYSGTESHWNAIPKGEDWDYSTSYSMTYNYNGN